MQPFHTQPDVTAIGAQNQVSVRVLRGLVAYGERYRRGVRDQVMALDV
jgi:hypothetical protein